MGGKQRETVSPKVAALASDVLAGRIKPTAAQIATIAASALTIAADKKPTPRPGPKKRG